MAGGSDCGAPVSKRLRIPRRKEEKLIICRHCGMILTSINRNRKDVEAKKKREEKRGKRRTKIGGLFIGARQPRQKIREEAIDSVHLVAGRGRQRRRFHFRRSTEQTK